MMLSKIVDSENFHQEEIKIGRSASRKKLKNPNKSIDKLSQGNTSNLEISQHIVSSNLMLSKN